MKKDDFPSAFYRQRSDTLYEPTEATIGPWSSDHQHGGPPAALLTRALRTHQSSNGLRIVRLTIEILGPVPVQPCDIKVDIVRSGHRVELLEGQLFSEEKTLLRAHAWLFKPETAATEPVPHPFELPKLPGSQVQRSFPGVDYFPYWHALEWRFTEGAYDKMGPATVWTKPRIPLLEGHDTHGLEALVLMIDSANGISAELDIRQWTFVPVDITLGLYRQPLGPWVGMSARTIIGEDGIGQTSTIAFDSHGSVGQSIHTLFVRPR